MTKDIAPIRIGSSELHRPRHVCAFFTSDEEEYRVLLPFIEAGLSARQKAVHVVSPHQIEEHTRRLTEAGIDVVGAKRRGQFELRSTIDTYLQNGRFDCDRMLRSFEELASSDEPREYPLSRIVCRMDWAIEAGNHVDDLLEFESRVNDVWSRHDDAVICTYRLDKFGGDVVIDMMRTHPAVIIGGILQRNPFFVPPEEFLGELRERRAAQGARATPA
jgi:hypothetical protein